MAGCTESEAKVDVNTPVERESVLPILSEKGENVGYPYDPLLYMKESFNHED